MIVLRDDLGSRRMKNNDRMFERVHLYVLYPLSQPEIVEHNPLVEYPDVGPTVVEENQEGPTVEGGVENVVSGPNVADSGVRESGPNLDVNNNGPSLDLKYNGPRSDENVNGLRK
jgi:hypothetical protein